MQATALESTHTALGARMVPFAGWNMPVQYRGILDEARTAIREDGVDAIVLGCAGMAELCEWLSREAGVPVIYGVVAAVKLAEALASGGFRTSKAGAYAYPRDKSGDVVTTH